MSEADGVDPREPKPESATRPEIRRPPVLFEQTQPLLDRLERLLGGPLVTYWVSPSASMAHEDVMALDHVLRRAAIDDQVFVFIKSDGGQGTAALRMTNILRHWARKVSALVPLDAASAATMLAIGADEIHVGPLGYLSAVDTSIRHELSPLDHINDRVSVSHDELVRVVRLWNQSQPPAAESQHPSTPAGNPWGALFGYVHPLVIGAVDRASSLSIKLCTEILAYHMSDHAKAHAIARALNEDYPAHGYPITLREAQRIGLPAKPLAPEVDELLIQLSRLYAEMGQRADTDFDPRNYHSNEIRKIVETRSVQLYYQVDKDWHYRETERRWSSLHDRSSWREMRTLAGEVHGKVVHFG
ncbi:SDH family Clp fold serine proteinase [Nannocystaceae bacterium ST9]